VKPGVTAGARSGARARAAARRAARAAMPLRRRAQSAADASRPHFRLGTPSVLALPSPQNPPSRAQLYLGLIGRPSYSRTTLVTPAISGLFNGAALAAAADGGVAAVVGDNTWPSVLLNGTNPYHPLYTTLVRGFRGFRVSLFLFFVFPLPRVLGVLISAQGRRASAPRWRTPEGAMPRCGRMRPGGVSLPHPHAERPLHSPPRGPTAVRPAPLPQAANGYPPAAGGQPLAILPRWSTVIAYDASTAEGAGLTCIHVLRCLCGAVCLSICLSVCPFACLSVSH
jgi:hypothetical protein